VGEDEPLGLAQIFEIDRLEERVLLQPGSVQPFELGSKLGTVLNDCNVHRASIKPSSCLRGFA
jgi:hypothetical protein